MPSDAGHRCEYRDFSLLHDNLLLQCFILMLCIVYVKSVIFYLNFCIRAMPLNIGVRLGICLYDRVWLLTNFIAPGAGILVTNEESAIQIREPGAKV